MRKIKILHLIDQCKLGGPGKTIINSNRFIDKQKFKIFVGIYREEGRETPEIEKYLIKWNIPYVVLSDKRLVSIDQIKTLKKFVFENQIQILHAHGFKTNLLSIVAKCIIKRIIIATTYHGWITNDLKQKIYFVADLIMANFFSKVVFVSEHTKNRAYRFILNKKKISVVHNAIVDDDYVKKGRNNDIRMKHGIKTNEILIGIIGRLSREKGVLDAVKGFSKFHNEAENTKLIIIGDGPEKEKLDEFVSFFELGNKVLVVGHKDPIKPYFESIDILISSSKTEGLSNVILEALSLGVPVIATKVGGNQEIIRHEHNGLLINYGNIDELRNAVLDLVQHEERRWRYVENGYRVINEKFSFQERMKKMQKIYFSLLKKLSTN